MQHLLKIILFSVRVPVLSVKMYSTCAKSSLIAVLHITNTSSDTCTKERIFLSAKIKALQSSSYFAAWAGVPVSGSIISLSQSINFAYKLFTRSKDTCHIEVLELVLHCTRYGILKIFEVMHHNKI